MDQKKNNESGNKRLWVICANFGLSVGITIYILGFLLGGWLDDKWGCAPICTLCGVLLAIACCFARLIYSISALDNSRKEQSKEK